jgi:DNA-binding GntR family transcriptional regulator
LTKVKDARSVAPKYPVYGTQASGGIMSLSAVDRPQSLTDRVYQTLREHVCSGQLPSGKPLQEAHLAAQLGVSRTPVREALGRLASEGLLDFQGRSLSVPSLSERDVTDIYELRLLLEPEALRQVAHRLDAGDKLLPLRHELDAMTAAHIAGDAGAFMQANYRYRAAWLALVPNQRLLRAIELYAAHVRYLRALTLGSEQTRQIVLSGLERLAAALTSRDAEAAAGAMREHLSEAKHILQELLSRRDDGEDGNSGDKPSAVRAGDE